MKTGKKPKIYISGKITGLSYEQAFNSFEKAEKICIAAGYDVVNPMKLNHKHDKSWVNYMKVDIKKMMDCTEIFMLKGFEQSKGALIEFNLAKDLEMLVHFYKLIPVKKVYVVKIEDNDVCAGGEFTFPSKKAQKEFINILKKNHPGVEYIHSLEPIEIRY